MKPDQITPAMLRLMSPEDRKHYDPNSHRALPHPQPKPNQAPALASPSEGEAPGFRGTAVRFTLFRVQPLDPDNAAASVKDLLDGLRHAALLYDDRPEDIQLQVEQVRVDSYAQEKTVIHITAP